MSSKLLRELHIDGKPALLSSSRANRTSVQPSSSPPKTSLTSPAKSNPPPTPPKSESVSSSPSRRLGPAASSFGQNKDAISSRSEKEQSHHSELSLGLDGAADTPAASRTSNKRSITDYFGKRGGAGVGESSSGGKQPALKKRKLVSSPGNASHQSPDHDTAADDNAVDDNAADIAKAKDAAEVNATTPTTAKQAVTTTFHFDSSPSPPTSSFSAINVATTSRRRSGLISSSRVDNSPAIDTPDNPSAVDTPDSHNKMGRLHLTFRQDGADKSSSPGRSDKSAGSEDTHTSPSVVAPHNPGQATSPSVTSAFVPPHLAGSVTSSPYVASQPTVPAVPVFQAGVWRAVNTPAESSPFNHMAAYTPATPNPPAPAVAGYYHADGSPFHAPEGLRDTVPSSLSEPRPLIVAGSESTPDVVNSTSRRPSTTIDSSEITTGVSMGPGTAKKQKRPRRTSSRKKYETSITGNERIRLEDYVPRLNASNPGSVASSPRVQSSTRSSMDAHVVGQAALARDDDTSGDDSRENTTAEPPRNGYGRRPRRTASQVKRDIAITGNERIRPYELNDPKKPADMPTSRGRQPHRVSFGDNDDAKYVPRPARPARSSGMKDVDNPAEPDSWQKMIAEGPNGEHRVRRPARPNSMNNVDNTSDNEPDSMEKMMREGPNGENRGRRSSRSSLQTAITPAAEPKVNDDPGQNKRGIAAKDKRVDAADKTSRQPLLTRSPLQSENLMPPPPTPTTGKLNMKTDKPKLSRKKGYVSWDTVSKNWPRYKFHSVEQARMCAAHLNTDIPLARASGTQDTFIGKFARYGFKTAQAAADCLEYLQIDGNVPLGEMHPWTLSPLRAPLIPETVERAAPAATATPEPTPRRPATLAPAPPLAPRPSSAVPAVTPTTRDEDKKARAKAKAESELRRLRIDGNATLVGGPAPSSAADNNNAASAATDAGTTTRRLSVRRKSVAESNASMDTPASSGTTIRLGGKKRAVEDSSPAAPPAAVLPKSKKQRRIEKAAAIARAAGGAEGAPPTDGAAALPAKKSGRKKEKLVLKPGPTVTSTIVPPGTKVMTGEMLFDVMKALFEKYPDQEFEDDEDGEDDSDDDVEVALAQKKQIDGHGKDKHGDGATKDMEKAKDKAKIMLKSKNKVNDKEAQNAKDNDDDGQLSDFVEYDDNASASKKSTKQ